MKKILSLLLAVVMLLTLAGCKNKNESSFNLSDKFKEASQFIKKGELEKAYELLSAIPNPNEEEKGLLSCFRFQKIAETNSEGIKIFYTYFQNGSLAEVKTVTESLELKKCYTYDEKGYLVDMKESGPGENDWTKYAYTYDEKGNLLTESKSASGTIVKTGYTYDAKGNCIEKTVVSGGETHKYSYTYNEKNQKIAEDYTRSNGYWTKVIYYYDDHGNLSQEVYTDSDNHHSKLTYTYDSSGKELSQAYEVDGATHSTVTNTYDSSGNLVTVTHTTTAGQWQEIFTYDKWGNCLTAIQSGNTKNLTLTYTWQLFYNPDFAK